MNDTESTESGETGKPLPEKWRDIAAGTEGFASDDYAKALRRCARELEESDRYVEAGTEENNV